MKRTIFPLMAAVALIACLTGCGNDKDPKPTNANYRTQTGTYRDGQYYANNDGLVYDADDPNRTGMFGNFQDDVADGVRRTGDAVGDAIDDMTL